MKDSGGTDDLTSGNESGTEEKTSDHEVRAGEKDASVKSKHSADETKKSFQTGSWSYRSQKAERQI